MIKNLISDYVHTMFDESRDGELIAGDADNQFEYPVDWDEQTANVLAEQCGTLVAYFTDFASRYENLKADTSDLSKDQLDAWNTYLRPFPKHGIDIDVLNGIWEKVHADEHVTEAEWSLIDKYVAWFEKYARMRLPNKRCEPVQIINRAKRYCKLVRLNAPEVVQVNEAKRFAEEFVLYHCLKQC